MNYSVQFTREAIFKGAKVNSGGNFFVIGGIWVITPSADSFYKILIFCSVIIALLSIHLIYLGVTYKSSHSEERQVRYENGYFFSTIGISIVLGILLGLQAFNFGFLSTSHLTTWVFIVAVTEALASYLYHYPRFYLANYASLYIPSLVFMFYLQTTESIVLGVIVLLYCPMIFMRLKELLFLKEQTVSLLQESKDKQNHLQTFLDLIPAKITWLDSDLNYIGVNKYFTDTNEKNQKKSIIGKKFGESSPDSLITKEINSFLKSKSKDMNCELTIDINGENRWHLCQFSKQNFSHGYEILLITIDINEQKVAERELEDQRSISDQASKFASLGEMAAGIAHEINNPLTIIQGSSQLLKTLVKKGNLSPDLLNKHLTKIMETNDRIVKIVTGMRTFSRSNDDSEFMNESIKDIVDTTLLFCREKFKLNNVNLTVGQIDADLFCRCHSQQINQILLNFLNNAFDAVNELNAGKDIDVYLEQNAGFNILCVSDTGGGIQNMEKIFTPYFTTKAPGKGTGIGLSISQKIANNHSGHIKASRVSGKTIFKLFLPMIDS